jgi:hypothetical protein
MTCREALLLLEFVRPGATELESAEVAALDRHLAACPRCHRAARAGRAWDERVTRTFNDVHPTPGAKSRLLDVLRQRRVGWWRLAGLRFAIVTLGTVVAWSLVPGPRLAVDDVVEMAQEKINNADAARAWLATQDRTFEFPPRFRAKYLLTYDRQRFHGVTSPVLVFVRHNTLARVAVLRESQFRNLRGLEAGTVSQNSACSLVVLREPECPGVVFVAEVLNGPVESLFSDDESPIT